MMYATTGEILFWIFSIGLVVGFTSNLIFGEQGVSLPVSLGMSLLGAFVLGGIALISGLPGVLTFGLFGSICFIFICNVFQQEEHDVEMNTR